MSTKRPVCEGLLIGCAIWSELIAVKMPSVYTIDLLQHERNSACSFPGHEEWNEAEYYCPIYTDGFLPFLDEAEMGTWGYYWPLEREDELPVVVHAYEGCLIPLSSSLEAACRLHQACYGDDYGIARAWNFFTVNGSNPDRPRETSTNIDTSDFRGLLKVDPDSPRFLCGVADLEADAGNLDLAQAGYNTALTLVPEYTNARIGMIWVLLQLGRLDEAREHSRLGVLNSGIGIADYELPGRFRKFIRSWQSKLMPVATSADPLLEAIGAIV